MTDPSSRQTVLGDPRDYGFTALSPRLWHGMTTWAWASLVGPRLMQVDPRRYPLVATVTMASLVNSASALLTQGLYFNAIRSTEITEDPVFIIGFQRSGTTWLNELLACDPRFGFPTNLQCLMPETYLLHRHFMRPLMKWAVPRTRPMDNVDLDPDTPQEDEVALLVSGVPSPYRLMAFPQTVSTYRDTLRHEQDDPAARTRWTRAWLRFLTEVQLANPGKRLLLKSPSHTVRVERILQIFPKARFIHITRDPYPIIRSNLKLNESLTATQGLQGRPADQNVVIEELLDGFVEFHEVYDEAKAAIPEGSLVTVAYEDLLEDPEPVLRRIYDTLDLGDFAPVEAPLRAYMDKRAEYQVNSYDRDPDLIRAINARLGAYFETYGYQRYPEPERQAGA
ncbi:MAG: sulfotransferase family protein [Rhodobacteraceae bacterium]|nr:sulfotransferase family protein [Paracoccaceae bacterium]